MSEANRESRKVFGRWMRIVAVVAEEARLVRFASSHGDCSHCRRFQLVASLLVRSHLSLILVSTHGTAMSEANRERD